MFSRWSITPSAYAVARLARPHVFIFSPNVFVFAPIGALRICVVNADERQAHCGKYCNPSHVLKIMHDHRDAPLLGIEPSASLVV